MAVSAKAIRKLAVLGIALVATATPCEARDTTVRIVAVVPLAANDTGVPYAVLPTRSELFAMTAQVNRGLSDVGVMRVAPQRVARVVAALGFDQAVPERSCVVMECARKIGRQVHADDVIVGSVTRAMAVVWGTEFSIVDVHSGKVVAAFGAGFKGDVQAMEQGDRDAGACIARIVTGKPRCPPDKGW